jgi:hypothetical protein
MPAPTDDNWRKDMGVCVLGGGRECVANIPEACLCQQMPQLVYEEAYRQAFGEWAKAGEES